MHNVIEVIDLVFDLPVNSCLAAIQEYNARARAGKFANYGNVLRAILGIDCQELENPDHARVQVGYVIQESIATHLRGEPVNPNSIYVEATAKARSFSEEMPWVFAKPEVEVKLDEQGRVRPKKGTKGERSYELYCELVKEGASRKEIIEAFQSEEEMGMTPHSKSGATTYYYNMKRKYED